MGMALPNLDSFSTPTLPSNSNSASDDKKIRKPYTITKSRESWTEPEHDKFLEALQLFDRDWKKIEAFVGSKTVIQIRSHAQKYFLKVLKSGTNEHLPPPRPKRKAAHPYPQKASKNAPVLAQVTASLQNSPAVPEPGFILTDNSVHTVGLPRTRKGDLTGRGQAGTNNCCSSTESTPRVRPTSEMNERGHGHSLRVLPDFAQVYGFIGSVFDPDASDHLQKLKRMDPIDVETVLLLMRNLSINLTSPDFEHHKRLLSTYEIESDKENSDDVIDSFLDCQPDLAANFGT